MYSVELKLEIVQCYLNNHENLAKLAKEYCALRDDIQKWRSGFMYTDFKI